MTATYERGVERLFWVAAFASASATVFIFGFMVYYGLPLFSGGRLVDILTSPWAPHQGLFGISPMIAGTLVISLLAMLFAFPLSLGCATLISVVARGRSGTILRKIVEMMTGIPTVVYGMVGVFLLVPLIRNILNAGSGMCVLSASLMLAILIAPTMILLFCDSFDRVSRLHENAVLALGGTRIQHFLHVTLPHAWPGMLIAFTLGLGRAVGDTLIALMLAGNAVQFPGSVFDSARTLTAHIALVFASDNESLEFKAIFACGVTLYLFTTLLIMIIRLTARTRGPYESSR